MMEFRRQVILLLVVVFLLLSLILPVFTYPNQAPVASFTFSPSNPLIYDTVTFDASSSYDPDGSIVSYTWNFGDGNVTTVTSSIITHVYLVAASTVNYAVTLTVTDNDGSTGSATKIVPVTNPSILHVSLPAGTYVGPDADNWLSQCWLLDITGLSQTFTVRIDNIHSTIESYDTHLIIALNNAAYLYLDSLTVDSTTVPKGSFVSGTPEPYGVPLTWENDVYPTYFSAVLIGFIGPCTYIDVQVSVTFTDATGVRMHFDAYGSTDSIPPAPTNPGHVTDNPHNRDSTVLFWPPPNTPPVAVNDAYSVNEDTTLSVLAPGVLGNDYDVDGDPLTAALVSGPAHGTVTLNADGSFTYTPDANWNGLDSFTYKAHDGKAYSNVATVSITVTPVNDPPVAYNQSVTTPEDTPKAITLTASDPDGDPLTYIIVAGPSHGTLLGTPPSVTYTPNPDYNGPDSFTFKAYDGQAYSNIATVSITVTAPPPPPPPVGGVWVPINKFQLLAPWIGYASVIAVATASLVYVKRRKKQQN